MKITEKQKTIFVLVLATLAFIYSIASLIRQIGPADLSWILLIYSLSMILYVLITLKDWDKTE